MRANCIAQIIVAKEKMPAFAKAMETSSKEKLEDEVEE